MASAEQIAPVPVRRPYRAVPRILILGLFILRLPFLVGMIVLVTPYPAWVSPVYEIGTYLLTAIFILWERDRLAEYHIDSLALWIIILFKPVETLMLAVTGNTDQSIPSLIIWAIAISIPIYLRLSHYPWQKIHRSNTAWLLVGVLSGIALAGLLAYPASLQLDPSCGLTKPDVFSVIFSGISRAFYQTGYAAVNEEPFFRGILWGFLRKLGWKDIWIWLSQAALFTLGHLYYLPSLPISFWMIVPACGLVFGLLAWRSRSIATSMAAHGFVNSLTNTAGCILLFFRA